MTRLLSLIGGVLLTASVSAQVPPQVQTAVDAIRAQLAKIEASFPNVPPPPPPPKPGGPPIAGTQMFSCTFANSPTDCGFGVQQKASGRATIVPGGRTDETAVRLHTEPGDTNVASSGSAERNDLWINQAATGCYAGREQWWEHSIRFPADFVVPPSGGWAVVMDFHHTGNSGLANFQVEVSSGSQFVLRANAGQPNAQTFVVNNAGAVVKNQWYDFVYHVKWSAGSDGFFQAWINGVQKVNHSGPTLYTGQGCYLKLANYHSAFGQPTSVLHDRVIRYDVP